MAVSTPPGTGGIAVVRMSGPQALSILAEAWKGPEPGQFVSHTARLGWIADADGNGIDQVVALFFKGPNSYTGEDVVEISCHGSQWVQRAIVARLIECGASAAGAGEFTRRAFANGKLDLAQAEGVADMIAATSRASARLAASQLKGDYSRRLEALRSRLVDLGVLLELELDFSEEDVEFADRVKLIDLTKEILGVVQRLAASFKAGNAFKSGVPVAIAGMPNVGKSTLLNALAGEEKALVSDIPGTTRDVIEDAVEIDGILFRFLDTAGLRKSDDTVEKMGVERAMMRIREAAIMLFLVDPTQNVARQLVLMRRLAEQQFDGSKMVLVSSKADLTGAWSDDDRCIPISAKEGTGLDELRHKLVEMATAEYNPENELIVTNARHYEALTKAEAPLRRLLEGLEDGVSADFLAQDLREAERYLAEITGAVSSEDILHAVFSRYCIGK